VGGDFSTQHHKGPRRAPAVPDVQQLPKENCSAREISMSPRANHGYMDRRPRLRRDACLPTLPLPAIRSSWDPARNGGVLLCWTRETAGRAAHFTCLKAVRRRTSPIYGRPGFRQANALICTPWRGPHPPAAGIRRAPAGRGRAPAAGQEELSGSWTSASGKTAPNELTAPCARPAPPDGGDASGAPSVDFAVTRNAG
jgi:hypothetical protein